MTTALSDARCRPRGTNSALTTAPIPKLADSKPKPPAPSCELVAGDDGQERQHAHAQRAKLTLWTINARIGGECRV